MKKINDKKAILYVGNDKKRIFRTILFILADVFSVLVATVGALWVRFDFSFQGI